MKKKIAKIICAVSGVVALVAIIISYVVEPTSAAHQLFHNIIKPISLVVWTVSLGFSIISGSEGNSGSEDKVVSTEKKEHVLHYVAWLLVCGVCIFHGALLLPGFQTDAWAMKAPWFNDVGIVCCYGLFIVGGLLFIASIIGFLVTFTTKPNEPEMTLEEARQLLADSELSFKPMTDKEREAIKIIKEAEQRLKEREG